MALLLSLFVLAAGTSSFCEAGLFRQIPYSLGGRVVGKLTRAYTRSEISRDLFGGLGAVSTRSYPDPDTQQRVDLIVAVDPQWNRIIWSTSYQGETRISEFGEYGSGAAQMKSPSDLAFSSSGNLYVADTGNNRVHVFGWVADLNGPTERFFTLMFSIAGGTAFQHPDQVMWDDNGTPVDAHDDIVWVLDIAGARIAGYHIVYTGAPTYWSYSPYVALDLNQMFPARRSRRPISFTKGRSYSTPSQSATFCTDELLVYDDANHSFMELIVPRSTGTILNPATQVALTEVRNPLPDMIFTRLATDPWGNILALDRGRAQVSKLTGALTVVGTYGSPGTGGLGANQMLYPQSLAFNLERVSGSSAYSYGKQAIVGEFWSDATGMQILEPTLEGTTPEIVHQAGSQDVKIGLHFSDHCRLRLRMLDGLTGAVVRTIADQIVPAGRSEFTWNGRNDAGSLVGQCSNFVVDVQGVSLYAATETVSSATVFFYKPRVQRFLTVTANQPGTQIAFDGGPSVLGASSTVFPCSLCTTHTISVVPTQTVGTTRYCFDRWSDATSRIHSVSLERDSSVTLYLTGPGPTSVQSGVLWDEAYDCKSPYKFPGNASLGNKAGWDTFRTYGRVSFRFPHAAGSQPRYSLTIGVPAVMRDATFETVDSASTQGSNLWSGVTLSTGGYLDCDGCLITNANYGIFAGPSQPARGLRVRNSGFENNALNDIWAAFDSSGHAVVSVTKNYFTSRAAVALTIGGNSIQQWGTAEIDSNSFAASGASSGALRLTGGWGGTIQGNSFYLQNNGDQGIYLVRYGNYSWPVPSIHKNRFITALSSNRFSLIAPPCQLNSFLPITIDAIHNNWGVGDSYSNIEQTIKHGGDGGAESGRAWVYFEPWDLGPAGGGNGCPYVFTKVDSGYVVENSILGLSEVSKAGAFVSDALPLVSSALSTDGRLQLRVAELESDVDQIDHLALLPVKLADGEDLGADQAGNPIIFSKDAQALSRLRWSGRADPFISPIAPREAYTGEAGDSLELASPPGSIASANGRRRIYISLVPKPAESAPAPGNSIGVTVRVSPDATGERWITLPPFTPREYWSTVLLTSGLEGDALPERVRLVWHGRHTLGAVGLASTREVDLSRALSPTSAFHSSGQSVLGELSAADSRTAQLLSGEHVDLEFKPGQLEPGVRLVLLSRGRYDRSELASTAAVPRVFSLSQNRPNPFNPETSVGFGLPVRSRVSLRIYDVAGRLVRTLVDRDYPAGHHQIRWNGKGNTGESLASGVYFYELKAGTFQSRRRMVLLR